jgi:hypothetical protein
MDAVDHQRPDVYNSDEDFERELDLAFDCSANAMDAAWERGDLTPEKIAISIQDFRSRHPYRND